MPTDVAGDEGRQRLAQRLTSVADAARAAFAAPLFPPPFDPRVVRRFNATGLGSSAAHARLLAECLGEAGLDARFTPTGALLGGPPADAGRDALLVFSQGLSPNARFALQRPAAWRAMALASAVTADASDPERRALREHIAREGGWLVTFPGEAEYGTLVRVAGPMAGSIAAIRMAGALASAAGLDASALAVDPDVAIERVSGAADRVEEALAGSAPQALHAAPAFLASGRYAGLLHNLQLKWLEALIRPLPPVWELLEFAHGPFQEAFDRPATWIALTRPGVPDQADLLERIESMLPARHHLIRLHATLPSPWCAVEHEALVDALVARLLTRARVDPGAWPGKDRDGALYALAPGEARAEPPARTRRTAGRRLESLSWPELSHQLETAPTTAVLPLGATEQHGRHLPFATDSWIADALAERLCARIPDAIRLPTLPVGCSSEHASFPGTLSLRPETLGAVLADLLRALADHGFAHAFVFSAHGGNCGPLEDALPALRQIAKPMQVSAFTDIVSLARVQHAAAQAQGVAPAAAGHHAGEFETSILAALRPRAVRRDALAPGTLHPGSDAQTLFYPDLRRGAPDGTVGDPRDASPDRAERYLEVWTDLLADAYRTATAPREANHTKGV